MKRIHMNKQSVFESFTGSISISPLLNGALPCNQYQYTFMEKTTCWPQFTMWFNLLRNRYQLICLYDMLYDPFWETKWDWDFKYNEITYMKKHTGLGNTYDVIEREWKIIDEIY